MGDSLPRARTDDCISAAIHHGRAAASGTLAELAAPERGGGDGALRVSIRSRCSLPLGHRRGGRGPRVGGPLPPRRCGSPQLTAASHRGSPSATLHSRTSQNGPQPGGDLSLDRRQRRSGRPEPEPLGTGRGGGAAVRALSAQVRAETYMTLRAARRSAHH